MTVSEIIEQIKALPASEQEKVAAFVRDLASSVVREESSAEKLPRNQRFGDAADHVFTEYKDLLGKLAQ